MVARRKPQAVSAAPDVTLQINLCAGDLAYGKQIVAALAAAHRSDVREVVVVADACRPQSTPLLHAPGRFAEPAFSERLARLRTLCATLQSDGLVQRVEWLEPDTTALRTLNHRYSGLATPCSHDHLGHAFSAYFLGWECARTRYVAHFDADILLWQQPGFSWLHTACVALARDETLLAASPRIAPPADGVAMVRVEAPGSGWLPTWPLIPAPGGWRSPWFSTRCHLMDRERLARVLPIGGSATHRRAASVERLLAPLCTTRFFTDSGLGRRLARRVPAWPLPPEVLLHAHAQARGFSCLYLDDPRAWFIHPDTKPDRFLRLLPRLLDGVAHGEVPPAQRGVSGVQFAAWES